LVLGGKQYDIDGLAFRDHGWGRRVWTVISNHRWVAATFGVDLTVLAINIHTTDDIMMAFGCVIRNNTLIYTSKVDILTYMEADGITHRGCHVRLELVTGEVMDFDVSPLQKGVVSWMADQMSVTDTMCKITCGDRIGICDFEISTNPTRGTHRPNVAVNAFIDDGLHRL
jgi:hypothetical protein